jgi:hypothetical protein
MRARRIASTSASVGILQRPIVAPKRDVCAPRGRSGIDLSNAASMFDSYTMKPDYRMNQ